MRFTRRSFLKGAYGQHRAGQRARPVFCAARQVGGRRRPGAGARQSAGRQRRAQHGHSAGRRRGLLSGRSTQSLRPDLAIPTNLLGATEIAPDPDLGTRLALHPNLPGLKALFDQGRLALVNGVGIDGSSLSHFEAEEVWYSGNPAGLGGTGWVGRHLDTLFNDGLPRAISFGQGVNASLPGLLNDAIGARSVDRFGLPEGEGDLAARRHAWDEIFAEARLPGTLASRAARSGEILLSTADILSQVETSGWGSYNDNQYGLGEDLRDVASILRHDALDPGNATGLCFFHVAPEASTPIRGRERSRPIPATAGSWTGSTGGSTTSRAIWSRSE